MPAPGSPVASTITSMAGWAISASALAVTMVRPCLSASSSEAAAYCSSGQPELELGTGARDVQVGDADDMHAVGQARLRQEHRAEFSGADQADGNRPAGRLALQQHAMKNSSGFP